MVIVWVRDVLTIAVLVLAMAVNVRWLLVMDETAVTASASSMVRTGGRRGEPINLLVAMMTVPRAGDSNRTADASLSYLHASVMSLVHETRHLAGEEGDHVAVVINNMRPGQHATFAALGGQEREEQSGITFRETIPRRAGINDTWEGLWGTVSQRTFQLNLDLLDFLRSAHWDCSALSPSSYVLLLEDDFVWCPFGLQHVFRAIRLAQMRDSTNTSPSAGRKANRPFLALRLSYGNNGLVLQCADLPAIITLAEKHKTLGPLDSLLGEVLPSATLEPDRQRTTFATIPPGWRGRPYYTYRYNLMEHIGHVSARLGASYGKSEAKTDRSAGARAGTAVGTMARTDPLSGVPNYRRNWSPEEMRGSEGRLCYPQCFAPIQYVGLMPMENFADACLVAAADDLSPCVCNEDEPNKLCRGLPFRSVIERVDLHIKAGLC